MRKIIFFSAFLFTSSLCFSQNSAPSDAPNIFIDCKTYCFGQFLKQELVFVNHMLNRQTAEVFIQITSQDTGSGGEQYQIEITGKGRFDCMKDTTNQNVNLNSRFSASKITEKVKIEPRIYYNYSKSIFSFEGEEDDEFVITNSGASLKYVKTISQHWSAGFFADLAESSFSNFDLSASLQPAIEYNYFPYSEVQKKRFSALYRIGPVYNNYVETTIFDKGSFDIDLTSGNYLHDWELLFISLRPWIELNIVKGLSLDFGGSISLNRNQVNIPKGDATRDDVLLQQIQLKSNYNYYVWTGFSYRFGSRYNNVVNARF